LPLFSVISFSGKDTSNPSFGTARACHSIKKQPTSSLCRFHLRVARELNFHQFPPAAFQRPITPFTRSVEPWQFCKISPDPVMYTRTPFCADPFRRKVSRVRVRFCSSHRKFITGANSLTLLLSAGVFCVYA
jgi:hypothetical protein